MVSTLDWALREIWKDAGIPLEAVVRGMDAVLAGSDQRPSKARKINGLGWCARAVRAAAEDMKEAVVGAANGEKTAAKPAAVPGFEPSAIAAFLRRNADLLKAAKLPEAGGVSVQTAALEASRTLRKLAEDTESKTTPPHLYHLYPQLTFIAAQPFP